jgi:hypothetical protein
MADEIYINIGSTIQQPYQGQAIATGTSPVIRQRIARQPANQQVPFTYQNRSPFTYARQGRTPAPYQHQVPATYVGQGRQPSTYVNQQPSTYRSPVDARQPYIANARQPSTYQNQIQTPYIANARQPSIYNLQGNIPYQNPVIAQQPYQNQVNKQIPFTYTNQTTYQYTANAQQPYPYIANGQYVAQTQQPYTYPYIANRQNTAQQPASYRHPVIANRQTTIDNANPSIANRQTAVDATYQVIAQQPAIQEYTYQANAQASVQAQSPYIAQIQGSYGFRQPATYQFTTQSIAQRPVIYTATGNYQASYQTSIQQPYIYQQPNQVPATGQNQLAVAYTYPDPIVGEYFHGTGNHQQYSYGGLVGTDEFAAMGSRLGSYYTPAGVDGNTNSGSPQSGATGAYLPPFSGVPAQVLAGQGTQGVPTSWKTTQRMGGQMTWTGLYSHDPAVNNHIQLKPSQPMRLNATGQWSRIEYAYWSYQSNTWNHISGIPVIYMQAVNTGSPTGGIYNIQGVNWIVGGGLPSAHQGYTVTAAPKRLRFY